MRYLPLLACGLLLAAPAKADKFWLSDPEAAQNTAAGSSPDVIEGVLLAEDQDGYHLRIVGGEIVLPKARVKKVEKDDLDLSAIVASEREMQQKARAADEQRRLTQEIAKQERAVQVAEAAVRRSEAIAPAATRGPVRIPAQPGFDPVLGVAGNAPYSDQDAMIRDAQLAWTMTQDRVYLRLLRQLRRQR